MKFSLTRSFLVVIAFAVLATAEEWSWSKDKTKDGQDNNKSSATDSAEVAAASRESKSIDSYSEANDDSSGGSQEDGVSAAVNGSDTQPRHIIKDRLCGLGLMEVKTIVLGNVCTIKKKTR